MGFFDFLKGNTAPNVEDVRCTLELTDMRTGCYVDYDMLSWKVEAAHSYDWDGDVSLEWKLVSASKTVFLQMEEDDEREWSMSETIAFNSLDSTVRNVLAETGDPPKTVVYDGITYHLQTVSGGHFLQNGQQNPNVAPKEMLAWDFESDDGQKYLSIEQWAEDDFTASVGHPVEEYQFTNILPAA